MKLSRVLITLAASYELFPFDLACRHGLPELEAMYKLEAEVRRGNASKTVAGGYIPTFKLLYEAGKLPDVPVEDSPTT